ncbi:class I SAM-dependent methyltransferase [Candidatus Daviesbacteria bacterium]|nr:class I SAM-dependent methyltransferase [Candidatus Daviesbacteria bacterium]
MFKIKNPFIVLRNFFKRYINKKYPSWDITIALRYFPIVSDLKKIYQDGEKILEVGSEISGITPYLKKKVYGVDINFDYSKQNKYLKPIKASAINLPFKNNSIEYILSVDMLEHLNPKLRIKAIKEMLRVAKKKIFLSFPTGLHSEKVDLDLYLYFKKIGFDYPYLMEHINLGLPNFDEIVDFIRLHKNIKLKVKGNTNIFIWKNLLKLGMSNHRFKSSLYKRFLILFPILRHLNFHPTYRKLFILELL